MRQGVADNFGGYFAITATADGNDAKTSIVASGLKNLPNGLDEGALYNSDKNIFDNKGTLSIWVKPDWTGADNNNFINYSSMLLLIF